MSWDIIAFQASSKISYTLLTDITSTAKVNNRKIVFTSDKVDLQLICLLYSMKNFGELVTFHKKVSQLDKIPEF